MPLYLGNQKIDKVLTEHTSFILDAPNELSEQETIIENLQDAVKTLGINIAKSNDGILDSVEWTEGENLILQNITYGNDIWVGSVFNTMYYSNDGITWTASSSSPTSGVADICYANNIFVASTLGDGIYYSNDGMNWTKGTGSKSNGLYNYIVYADGKWVVGGDYDDSTIGSFMPYTDMVYSTDGINWQVSPDAWSEFWCSCLQYANGKWVMGGYESAGIIYSSDGLAWEMSNLDASGIEDICYGNNLWMAATYGDGTWYSVDGENWTRSNMSVTTLTGIGYGNGMFIVSSEINGLHYSTDTINWYPCNGISKNYYWGAPQYIQGLWIVSGHGGVYHSKDGINWTDSGIMTSDNDYASYASPTYSNGLLFVGYDEKTYYSTGTWLEQELTAVEKLQRNNDALAAIIDAVNNANFTNIYPITANEEPNASVGKDGDLMLVVSE